MPPNIEYVVPDRKWLHEMWPQETRNIPL